MSNTPKQKILIIDSRDCPGVARGFLSKFQRNGLTVTLSTDDTNNFDKETMILPLLEKQKFDVILFLCSEVYNWDDQRWQVVTFDWSILGWKKQSINAGTPLVAVTTAPDDETISRFEEVGVTHIIDRGDKPSAKQVSSMVLKELPIQDVLMAK